jgi:ribosomal protein S12 methylthiotransferase
MLNIPNLLTLLRLVLIPVFVIVFYFPVEWSYFAAAVFFVLAAVTDWFDGYLARKLNQTTPFGAFLDPVADKVMVATALVLILVAQETTMYGKDIYGKKSLHILLKELAKISGIYWIRILYCYPEEIYDELIDVIASEKKICNYLDLPIQHASDTILKKMGRRTTNKDLRDIIGKLRKRIPDIVLRTTLITGFPGETEEDHQINLDFVNEMEFERLGVFTYSAEENTPAANMPNQIDEEVKEDRRNDIMELQQDIVFDNSEKHIGKTYIAMIEGRISGENAYMGRTYMDVPGIDSNIFIITDEELMTGDFVKVKVTGINDYDLIGQLDE